MGKVSGMKSGHNYIQVKRGTRGKRQAVVKAEEEALDKMVKEQKEEAKEIVPVRLRKKQNKLKDEVKKDQLVNDNKVFTGGCDAQPNLFRMEKQDIIEIRISQLNLTPCCGKHGTQGIGWLRDHLQKYHGMLVIKYDHKHDKQKGWAIYSPSADPIFFTFNETTRHLSIYPMPEGKEPFLDLEQCLFTPEGLKYLVDEKKKNPDKKSDKKVSIYANSELHNYSLRETQKIGIKLRSQSNTKKHYEFVFDTTYGQSLKKYKSQIEFFVQPFLSDLIGKGIDEIESSTELREYFKKHKVEFDKGYVTIHDKVRSLYGELVAKYNLPKAETIVPVIQNSNNLDKDQKEDEQIVAALTMQTGSDAEDQKQNDQVMNLPIENMKSDFGQIQGNQQVDGGFKIDEANHAVDSISQLFSKCKLDESLINNSETEDIIPEEKSDVGDVKSEAEDIIPVENPDVGGVKSEATKLAARAVPEEKPDVDGINSEATKLAARAVPENISESKENQNNSEPGDIIPVKNPDNGDTENAKNRSQGFLIKSPIIQQDQQCNEQDQKVLGENQKDAGQQTRDSPMEAQEMQQSQKNINSQAIGTGNNDVEMENLEQDPEQVIPQNDEQMSQAQNSCNLNAQVDNELDLFRISTGLKQQDQQNYLTQQNDKNETESLKLQINNDS